jgi:hypothetical protein
MSIPTQTRDPHRFDTSMFDTCDRHAIESHRLQTACNLGFVDPIPERLSSSTVLLKMVLVTN